MKKIMSVVLSAILAVSTLSLFACGDSGEQVDNTKEQLYVNVLECGVGFDFIQSLKQNFEREYADKDFGNGRKGVQVMITNTRIDGDTITSALAGGGTDVFYVANMDLSEFIKLGDGTNPTSEYIEDITDVVTEGGDNSIEARMFETEKDFYNVSNVEGSSKYFVLPWFSNLSGGLVYDVGLFKEKHLFPNDPQSEVVYKGLDGIAGTEDDNYGPNGKTGIIDGVDYSFDDNLPATWSDFDALIEEMKAIDVTPFCFTNLDDYTTSYLYTLWAAYEGKNNAELLKTFNGDYRYRTTEGEIETIAVNESNGYEVAYQNGKKAAVSIAEKIVKGKLYEDQCFYSSTDNIKAQKLYLGSKAGMYQGVKPIAFLMEGVWWENEAKDYFGEIAGRKGPEYAYGTREFGIMPTPKFEGDDFVARQVDYESSVLTFGSAKVSQYGSGVFINKKSEKKDIAKLFLKYAYSDAMNADFTVSSGIPKPFEYELTSEQTAKLTSYQRNVFTLTQNPSVVKVSNINRNKYILTQNTMIKELGGFASGTGSNKKTNVFTAFYDTDASGVMTKLDYWNGIKSIDYKTTWQKVGW